MSRCIRIFLLQIFFLILWVNLNAQYTLPQLFPGMNFIGYSNANNSNINHPGGTEYQYLKRATGIIIDNDNGTDGFCSCTIVNSAPQQGKILLLTAAHCLPSRTAGAEVGLTISFNYEHPHALERGSMATDEYITRVFVVGGTIRLMDRTSDLALVELRKEGSEEWYENVFAAGWNASLGIDPNLNISHPARDHKKVFSNPEKSQLSLRKFMAGNDQIREGLFYETKGTWNGINTYPQKGSSGSGIYDSHGSLLGVLSAGDQTDQLSSAIANNWYNSESGASMRTYLDPDGHWLKTLPGGYLNDLVPTAGNFNLTLAADQLLETPGIHPSDPSMLSDQVSYLRPWMIFDDLNYVNTLESLLGIKLLNPDASPIQLTVHALLKDEATGEYFEKLIFGSIADNTVDEGAEGFRMSSWQCGTDLVGIAPCERQEDQHWWPIQQFLGNSIDYIATIARAFVTGAREAGDIQSIKDAKIPVIIRLKNLGTSSAQVQALSYPGEVPTNALQLFRPDQVSNQFQSYKYRSSSGEHSDPLYIDQLTVSQDDQIVGDIETGNNGGYLNLVNPNFRIGKVKVSWSQTFKKEIELKLNVVNQVFPYNYKIWVDYFNTEELEGRRDLDLEDPSQSYTYNFVDDPVAHPLEEVAAGFASDGLVTLTYQLPTARELQLEPGQSRKTRLRVAVSNELLSQNGEYNLGEVEDYLIELVAPTNQEIVEATESSVSKRAHLTGRPSADLTCDNSDEAPADDLEAGTHDFGLFEITGCPSGDCYNTSNKVTYGSSIAFVGSNILQLDQCNAFISQAFAERTVAMWIYPTENGLVEMLYDEGGAQDGLAIRLNNGMIEAQIASNGQELRTTSNTSLVMNQWHHIMVVYDDGKLLIYQNDDPAIETDGSSSFTSIPDHSDPSAVGGSLGTNAFGETPSNFTGLVNNVIIWNYAVPITYALAKYRLYYSGTSSSARLVDQVGQEEAEVESQEPVFSVFPNPASDQVNVLMEVRKAGPFTLKIFDLNGKQVYEMKRDYISEGHQLVSLKSLNLLPATYILKVRSGNQLRKETILIN